MAIEVEKSNLVVNRLVAKKNENIIVEGDCIVPDIKPDIINIIGTSGIVNVYKKEISEGKVRIDGCISAYVMYNGSEENKNAVRCINHTLDFSQVIIIPEATSKMTEIGEISLINIECKIINERKINIKANLNINIELSDNCSIDYISNINLNDLQKQETKVNVNSVVGIGKTKTSVKENISIDNADTISEILKVDINIKNIDTKMSYKKVLIKSDLYVKLLYSTEDGRFNITESTFPIMGFIEMEDISEDDIINTNIEIKNSIIHPNGSQEHTISVDIEIEMGIIAYSKKQLSIVKDMYSPNTFFSFNQKSVQTMQNAQVINSIMNMNKKELLDIGEEKIYDVDTKININDIKIINNSILIMGNNSFKFTYSTNKMTGIDNKTIEIPFEHKVSCDNIKSNALIKIKSSINNENYNIMTAGEIELRMDINFQIETYNNIEIQLINKIEEEQREEKNKYNMVIYYTKNNDNLWQIAKMFRTTQDSIIKENNLENTNLQAGTQLFIL